MLASPTLNWVQCFNHLIQSKHFVQRPTIAYVIGRVVAFLQLLPILNNSPGLLQRAAPSLFSTLHIGDFCFGMTTARTMYSELYF